MAHLISYPTQKHRKKKTYIIKLAFLLYKWTYTTKNTTTAMFMNTIYDHKSPISENVGVHVLTKCSSMDGWTWHGEHSYLMSEPHAHLGSKGNDVEMAMEVTSIFSTLDRYWQVYLYLYAVFKQATWWDTPVAREEGARGEVVTVAWWWDKTRRGSVQVQVPMLGRVRTSK
jgi:hypothetical protein